MKMYKKILFLFLLSITISLVMDNVVSVLQQNIFTIENANCEPNCTNNIYSEIGNANDEVQLNNTLVNIEPLLIVERICLVCIPIQSHYPISFWQPPKIS